MSFKKCKVVMLATNKKANIFIGSEMFRHSGTLSEPIKPYGYAGQHLYITSNEVIKLDDWYIDDTDAIRKSVTDDKEYWSRRMDYLKVIATTDISLNLPHPSSQFIDKFIEEYNKGNVITDVMVKYEDKLHYGNTIYKDSNKQTLKVNSKDNTITIKKVSPLTERDMYLNMQYYMEYCQANGYVTPQAWITKFKHFN